MHESEKWKGSHLVVSDPQWPHGLQPSRLLCPSDFPGKSTGVGCYCPLQEKFWVMAKLKQRHRDFPSTPLRTQPLLLPTSPTRVVHSLLGELTLKGHNHLKSTVDVRVHSWHLAIVYVFGQMCNDTYPSLSLDFSVLNLVENWSFVLKSFLHSKCICLHTMSFNAPDIPWT